MKTIFFKRKISITFFLILVCSTGATIGLGVRHQLQQKNAELWLIENGFELAFDPDSAKKSWRSSWVPVKEKARGLLDEPPYNGFLESIGLDRIRNRIRYVGLPESSKNFETKGENAFRFVNRLSGTEKLWLNCNPVTDFDVSKLRGLNRLKELELIESRITDNSLEVIFQFSKLERLLLGNTKVTDSGIQELDRLNLLESLDLSDCKITGSCFLHMRIETLRHLDLSRTNVGKDCIDKLSESFPNLEMLSLTGVSLSDRPYQIAKLSKLKTLHVNETEIGDRFVSSSLPEGLESFIADSTQLTDESIPTIRSLELEYFSASQTAVSEELVEEINEAAYRRATNKSVR